VRLLALWGALAAIDVVKMCRVQGCGGLWQLWGAIRHPSLPWCNKYDCGASE
jgi:hypothetical protein